MNPRPHLGSPVEHIDCTTFDASPLIDAMAHMSFSARDTASAARLFGQMIDDPTSVNILTLAGSTGAAGCLRIFADWVRLGMIDVVVATGAAIVDMDFFEALGYRHYQGSPLADDKELRENLIDRIYDTYIDELDLQRCDAIVRDIANRLAPGSYSSREFIREMGRFLDEQGGAKHSLVLEAYRKGVPIFCPAFSDSSAGFGLVMHQHARPLGHVAIDSVRDFHELTKIKIDAERTGLFIVGGGTPKNFAQDTVVCAELLGYEVPMHETTIQITVADVRDGACSSSTLSEANSWGKVERDRAQMVFAEATTVLPLIASYVYHRHNWRGRREPRYADFLERGSVAEPAR